MDVGIWGMGRMGFNMARRLVDKGDHRVIAGNRSPGKVNEAVTAADARGFFEHAGYHPVGQLP